MENRKLISRDEIYFLVFFSNFFIGQETHFKKTYKFY